MGFKIDLKNNLIILSGLLLGLALTSWIFGRQTIIVVEWSTASEFNTAGFNLYRGLSPDQINQKINSTIIPGSIDPLSGGKYQFQDDSVEPGTQYYYVIEEVDLNGTSSKFGPVSIKAVPNHLLTVYLPIILLVFGMAALLTGLYLKRKTD